MKRFRIGRLAVLVAIGAAAPAWAVNHEIEGVGDKGVYDCHGGRAVVNGVGHHVTLRDCRSVDVNGQNNNVRVEAVRYLDVAGVNNEVTWVNPGGQRPARVRKSGINNVVRGETLRRTERPVGSSPKPAKATESDQADGAVITVESSGRGDDKAETRRETPRPTPERRTGRVGIRVGGVKIDLEGESDD